MGTFKTLSLFFIALGLFMYGPAPVMAEGDWEKLRDATRQGDIKTMNQLIDSGVDIHHRDRAGWTVLHWWNFSFNEKNHMDALRLLIKRGVNVNAVDTRGRTALMLLLVPGDDQPPGPQLENQSSRSCWYRFANEKRMGGNCHVLGLDKQIPLGSVLFQGTC